MSINLKPIPESPLPVFRTSQYGWQNNTLTVKQADGRYVSLDEANLIAGGSFGVMTIRLIKANPPSDSTGIIAGYSASGSFQSALVTFASDKINFFPGVEMKRTGFYVRSSLGLNPLYFKIYTNSAVDRFVSNFTYATTGTQNYANQSRIIFIDRASNGLAINRFYICGGDSVSASFSHTPGNISFSTTFRAGTDFTDILYSQCNNTIFFIQKNLIAGNSMIYIAAPTTFGSGIASVPIPGPYHYYCLTENLTGRIVMLGTDSLSSPTVLVTAILDTAVSPSWSVSTTFLFEPKRVAYNWSQDLFVMVSDRFNTALPNMGVSQDGVNWAMFTIGSPFTQITDICYSPELDIMVACCSNNVSSNRIFTSLDGLIWNEAVTPNANTYQSIRWFREIGLFVAVSSDGVNRMITSPDGIVWTEKLLIISNAYYDSAIDRKIGFMLMSHSGASQFVRGAWVGRPSQQTIPYWAS